MLWLQHTYIFLKKTIPPHHSILILSNSVIPVSNESLTPTESPNHSPGCIVLPHPNKTGRGSILSVTLLSNVIIYLFCLNLCLAIKYHIPAHTDIIHQPCKCYTIFSCIVWQGIGIYLLWRDYGYGFFHCMLVCTVSYNKEQ